MDRSVYDHRRVAWCYEAIASLYSMGAIPRIKASQIHHLLPGERILYVGVGGGEDALLAAREGHEPVCLDASPTMLERCRRRLDREGLRAEFVCSDMLDHRPEQPYDVIAANFVLNLYGAEGAGLALERLASNLAPGGRLMIADFVPVPPTGLRRWLFELNYRPVNWAAWALGLCELHPIADYGGMLPDVGLEPIARWQEAPFAGAPFFYESLIARRPKVARP